jgi:hypothetical protein
MYILLIVLLVLLLVGAFPRAGAYSEGFGYAPSGLLGVLLVVLLVLLLMGRI